MKPWSILKVMALAGIISCSDDKNSEAVVQMEFSTFQQDSVEYVDRMYVQVWGIGKGQQGSVSRFVYQMEYSDITIPFSTDLIISEIIIRKAKVKYEWKDSIDLHFYAQLDVNGDTILCTGEYTAVGNKGVAFVGELPNSGTIKMRVESYGPSEFCDSLYPGMTIEKFPF